MENEPTDTVPIKIAISSCLLGEKVRYDGTDRKHDVLSQIPKTIIQFIPICPEVAIGMGIPRPPIQLVEIRKRIQAQQIDAPGKNFTGPLQEYGKKMAIELEKICGYIFKARSPSCGINSTPVFINGMENFKDTGLFAKKIIQELPDLPVTDETELNTIENIQHFFNRALDYCSQQNLIANNSLIYLTAQIKQHLRLFV